MTRLNQSENRCRFRAKHCRRHISFHLISAKMSKICKLNPEQRFQFIDDEQLDAKREDLKNKNIVKSNKKANTCFQNYLAAKGLSVEYWLFDKPTLDNILKKFWFKVRTVEGEYYMRGSLENLHYSIN